MTQHNGPARPFHIRVDRALTHPQVLALLEEHLAGLRAASPPGACRRTLRPALNPKPWANWSP